MPNNDKGAGIEKKLGSFAQYKFANTSSPNQVHLMDKFAQTGELALGWLGKMRGKHALKG